MEKQIFLFRLIILIVILKLSAYILSMTIIFSNEINCLTIYVAWSKLKKNGILCHTPFYRKLKIFILYSNCKNNLLYYTVLIPISFGAMRKHMILFYSFLTMAYVHSSSPLKHCYFLAQKRIQLVLTLNLLSVMFNPMPYY